MSEPKPKSLGQIAYEADKKHTRVEEFWGPWEKAPFWVRATYEIEAAAVAREVNRRRRAKTKK